MLNKPSPTSKPQHPFAEYIRILGKGKKGSRPLSRDQASTAMSMILADEVQPVQLGAFLMLMRVKEETPEELAGFVSAARASFNFIPAPSVIDLDWSSYAGKRRQLPWFIFSVLLLAENGIRIFMHGATGHTTDRIYTKDVLDFLGIPTARTLEQAAHQINRNNFSYLPLEHLSPKLHEIIELRPLLGLRSPVHTLVRLLNPFHCSNSIQGIFHPGYRPVHQQAALLLGQSHMAVLKGEGGETERNPDMICLVQSVDNGVLSEQEWPAMFPRRHTKPRNLDLAELISVWSGRTENEYAQATITGTAAIALNLLNKENSQKEAQEMAEQFWLNRSKNRFRSEKMNPGDND